MSTPHRIGTRGSKLALIQANMVAAQLAALGEDSMIVVIRTSGDKGARDVQGAFVREVQLALLEERIDIAVHCLKDLPTVEVNGIGISAYLRRDDPRDAMVTRSGDWQSLQSGARVGTGSLRRTAQLRRVRADFVFSRLVGNVDSRVERLLAGEFDAIVLAVAGLSRLGLTDSPSFLISPLDLHQMLPAAGQGTLVLETRLGEADRVSELNCLNTQACSELERGFLGAFGTGCSLPVGCLASIADEGLCLDAGVFSADGSVEIRATVLNPESGAAVAQQLIDRGALDMLRGGND